VRQARPRDHRQADVILAGKPLAATTDAGTFGAHRSIDYRARFTFDVAVVLQGSTPRETTVVAPSGPRG
jgi:hypothetical protein